MWFLVILASALVGLTAMTIFLIGQGRSAADEYSSSFAWLLAATTALVALLTWLWRKGTLVSEQRTASFVEDAVTALAGALTEQWRTEEAARRIHDPWPLPVRWKVSPRATAMMASWSAIRGVSGARPMELDGQYGQVSDMFTGTGSPERLVLLGGPGTGKSMLMMRLTIELLHRRTPADPVPLLLPIATWHPLQQPIDDWIADRLIADYRSLARPLRLLDGSYRSLAREMVARGRILPILDGLDEMPTAQHNAALSAIDNTFGRSRRFVLTCRTDTYEAAVAAGGPLAITPVVEIGALDPAEVANYLKAGTEQPSSRWDDVCAHLRGGAGSCLAEALSTPLMVWLTRIVFRRHSADPGQLLTADWATTREGIEQHLLDQLIPAAYSVPVRASGLKYPARAPRKIHQSQRWLTNIAHHLDANNTYDLAWWRLQSAASRLHSLAFLALLNLTVAGLAYASSSGLSEFLLGLTYVFLACVGYAWTMGRPRTPRRLARFNVRQFAILFMAGLATGVAVGLSYVFDLGRNSLGDLLFGGITLGLGLGLVFGLAFGFVGNLDHEAASPIRTLKDDRRAGRIMDIAKILMFACLFVVSLLLLDLVDPLSENAGQDHAMSWQYVALLAGNGLVFGSFAGLLSTASDVFSWVKVVLAIRRFTPLRLMPFLTEAHARGILSQSGAFYQFRHKNLQDRLATRATSSTAHPS